MHLLLIKTCHQGFSCIVVHRFIATHQISQAQMHFCWLLPLLPVVLASESARIWAHISPLYRKEFRPGGSGNESYVRVNLSTSLYRLVSLSEAEETLTMLLLNHWVSAKRSRSISYVSARRSGAMRCWRGIRRSLAMSVRSRCHARWSGCPTWS